MAAAQPWAENRELLLNSSCSRLRSLAQLSTRGVFSLPAGSPLSELPKGQQFSFEAPSYALWLGDQGPFASPLLRVRYSSLTQPLSTYDINMETGGHTIGQFWILADRASRQRP